MQDVWHDVAGWFRDHLSEWTLVKVYVACAVAGGAVLIGQTGLNLFGLGGGEDVDPDVDVDEVESDGGGLSFLSVRTLASFLTFFGLVGWGGTASGWNPGLTVLAAFAAGSSVMLFVAWVLRFFHRLASSGTVDPRQAIGSTARVYLRIPPGRSGKGKVTVRVQGRSLEFDAVTAGAELPSGGQCRIVGMRTDDTFEVESLDEA